MKTWYIALILSGLMLYGCYWFDSQIEDLTQQMYDGNRARLESLVADN